MAKVLFVCDVSPSIGTGHLRRCLTLARALRTRGAEVHFACGCLEFDAVRELADTAHGWTLTDLSLSPETSARELARLYGGLNAHAAVIDRYGISEESGLIFAESGLRWLQFDGDTTKRLWANWVVNPSPSATTSAYHGRLQRPNARLFLGPRYALVRDEFRRGRSEAARSEVRSILLTFGGGDDRGASSLCLEALDGSIGPVVLTILVSDANPGAAALRQIGQSRADVRIVSNATPAQTAEEMARADLAIIGGGMTTFEAAAMGLPALIIQIAPNQAVYARAWQHAGAALDLGPLDSLTSSVIAHRTRQLLNNPGLRAAMSGTGPALVDGCGSKRIAERVLIDVEGSQP
jgi:UDP-2,4-diacetamido-2,4,6-trideoxy-beta-L-altropyranose hydrolase